MVLDINFIDIRRIYGELFWLSIFGSDKNRGHGR